jgi:DNA repair exonuclease SbcCD nuclease subunit
LKSIIISDIHLSGYKKDKLHPESLLPERLHYIKKNLGLVVEKYHEYKADNIVILGDIFDDKDLLYSKSANIFQEFLMDTQEIPIIIVQGNHDSKDYENPEESLLNIFSNYPNVDIVYNYQKYDNIIFMGYKKNQRFIETMNDIMESYQPGMEEDMILFGHFDLNGAQLSNGAFLNAPVKLKDLSNYFSFIISGHIHKPQELDYKYKNEIPSKFIYVGSPIQTNWGERGEDKRILFFDSETLKYEEIPTYYKKHKVFKIETDEDLDLLKQVKEESLDEDTHIRVVSNLDFSDEDKKVLKENNVTLFIDKKIERERSVNINLSDSEEDKLKKYLEYKNVIKDKWDNYISTLGKYEII